MKDILEKLEKADKMLSAVPVSGDAAVLLVYAREELRAVLKELRERQAGTDAAKRDETTEGRP